MLHNVKIKAGQHTEIAKQGKFINVVLAAGEIEVRIRLNNSQVFQTTLVSGMAFPVPQGFQSVAITSDVSQQTKVWLSDIPLTYTSLDSRVVGASAIESTSAKVQFGTPQQLLPARAGRGKSIINATENIKVGGVNVSPSSAVTIPANTPFEISTQGALFAYSENPANGGNMVVDEVGGTFGYVDKVTAILNDKLAYCEQDNELLVTNNSYINRYNAADGSLIQAINLGQYGEFAPYDHVFKVLHKHGSDYYAVMSESGNTSLIKYDSVTKGVTETTLLNQGGEIQDARIDVINNRLCALVTVGAEVRLYHGSLTNVQSYTLPSFGSFAPYALGMWGASFIGVYGLQNKVTSTDKGVSFSAVTPIGFNVTSRGIHRDEQTGYLYTYTNTNMIKRSTDGVSFEDVHQSIKNIYAMWIAGGFVYAVGEGFFSYSTDSGASWKVVSLAEVTGDNGLDTMYSIDVAPTGHIYIHSPVNGLYRLGGKSLAVGGLDVAIMSEVN